MSASAHPQGNSLVRHLRARRCSSQVSTAQQRPEAHLGSGRKKYCSHSSSRLSSPLSLFLSAGMSGWLRDLTREGVEANPGPCQDGSAAAPCKCSLTKEELVAAGQPAVGGTCPDCGHKVSLHSVAGAPAGAPGGAAGQYNCEQLAQTSAHTPGSSYNALSLSLSLSLVSAGPKVLPASDPFSRFVTALTTAPAPTAAGLTAPPAPPPPAGGGGAPAAPPAVGQLLSLPANTFLFGLEDNGQHLYIRPCYTLLLTAILALFQTWRGVLVKGVAGVGKVRAQHAKSNGGDCCL
jgi:hypothetical protein